MRDTPSDARSPWPMVAMITVGLLLARLACLAWACPYTLAEDEAHYWEWSRSLDWSYYSKGPGIAWLIALTTRVLGDSEFGVRAGAAIFASIATVGVAGMAQAAFGVRRVTIASAALFNLIPFYLIAGLIATIDMPYVGCWAIASWAAVVALHERGRRAWLVVGAAIAIGFLFKYTMVLIVPGIVGAVIAARKARRHGGTKAGSQGMDPRWWRWAAMGAAIALLGLVPIVLWNAQRDWPTVRHLMGHLGLKGGDVPGASEPWTPLWMLEFVVIQVGLVGPALMLMGRAIWRTRRRQGGTETGRAEGTETGSREEARRRERTLVWIGLPLIVFYLLVSLMADAEGNWAIAGYVTFVPLAARVGLGRKVRKSGRQEVTKSRSHDRVGGRRYPAWVASWIVGFVVAGIFPRLDLLARFPVIGPFVPLGRLTGADVRAAHVAREMERVTDETGLDAFVIALHYGRASQLAYYLRDGLRDGQQGKPLVYCSGALMGGRRTQFDVWPETDLSRREVSLDLTGRPAVLVGGQPGVWDVAFEWVELLGELDGETKRGRVSFVGYGYRGFTGPGGR